MWEMVARVAFPVKRIVPAWVSESKGDKMIKIANEDRSMRYDLLGEAT